MENLFSKSDFPESPGGDRYEWKDAETRFEITEDGIFGIKIIASAKNGKQNISGDDDDLRVVLDGFSFGKYEIHNEKISWKGFGTSASWNGASLKGGAKTVYFFTKLKKGTHIIQFFADGKPNIKAIEVLKVQNYEFELTNLSPSENIDTDHNGIPWLSFIFLGLPPEKFSLDVFAKSAKEIGGNDGDNLKVVINGKTQSNEEELTSKKYKNFYFSGDIKSSKTLSLAGETLSKDLAFESAIELWYDQSPEIVRMHINFSDTEGFLEKYQNLIDIRKHVLTAANFSRVHFGLTKRNYSKKFLNHALAQNPANLVFRSNHPIVKKIKADPAYAKIKKLIEQQLDAGTMEGQIFTENIIFESFDLDYSIHGIKKIDFSAHPGKKGKHEVNLTLYDIYDFARRDIPFHLLGVGDYFKQRIVNAMDAGEALGIVSNFEIQVNLKDSY